MPSKSAAYIAMVIFEATGVVVVVDFANEYNSGPTGTPFPAAVLYQTVQLRSDVSTAPCYKCPQLWDIQPSPTLRIKISYVAPNLHSKPTPTPPPTTRKATTAPASWFVLALILPPCGAATLAVLSIWYQHLLGYLPTLIVRRAYGLDNALFGDAWVLVELPLYKNILWRLHLMTVFFISPEALSTEPQSYTSALLRHQSSDALLSGYSGHSNDSGFGPSFQTPAEIGQGKWPGLD